LLGTIFALAGANSALGKGKGKGPKPKQGELTSSVLLAYASTSGAGGNSGRIWEGTGNVPGIGKATVNVKASWNWSFYSGSAGGNAHNSALVNKTTVVFYACRNVPVRICAPGDFSASPDLTQGVVPADLTIPYLKGKIRRGHVNGFTADATVTITDTKGNVVNAAILSGSVTEVQVPSPSGGASVNEWFIGFVITGGTGKFVNATGTGFIHMVFDAGGTGTVYSDLFDTGLGTEVYQSDPARFTRHEIFLRDFSK